LRVFAGGLRKYFLLARAFLFVYSIYIMQASHASVSKARFVAVLLTAASPVIGSFGVSAQQMASGPDISKCEMIKDRGQRDNCLDASIADSKTRIKAATDQIAASKKQIVAATKNIATIETETAAADAEIACHQELRVVAQDPAKQAKGRELIVASGKGIAQYGACKLLQQLKN
jgi:septal ring factor EnvC (AmiA/AmiB activator)